MTGEKQSGETPLYGEGGDEAASMNKAAEREKGPGTAEKPGHRYTGKTEAGEPVPEQAPRDTHGVGDRRPPKA